MSSQPPEIGPEPGRAHQNPVVVGLMLMFLGLLLLLHNLTGLEVGRWWALIFLVPAVAAWNEAARLVRQRGGWSDRAVQAALGGVIVVLVALSFLMGASWAFWWPLLLIALGLRTLLSPRAREGSGTAAPAAVPSRKERMTP